MDLTFIICNDCIGSIHYCPELTCSFVRAYKAGIAVSVFEFENIFQSLGSPEGIYAFWHPSADKHKDYMMEEARLFF